MFHRYSKSQPANRRSLKELNPVLSVETLLAETKRRPVLERIMALCDQDPSRKKQDCETLVDSLVLKIQSLPESLNRFFSHKAGLLDHALFRTEAALQLFQEYLVKEDKLLSEQQRLWTYVLFSAAMLQGIGKLALDFEIDCYDQQGQFLKSYHPLVEDLSSSHWYFYNHCTENNQDYRRSLTLLLARTIMPESGFARIAEHPKVLSVWVALLQEDWENAGSLGAILNRAEAIALQQYSLEWMNELEALLAARSGQGNSFIDISPEERLAHEQFLLALQFMQWLSQQLAAGKIQINKAPLFMVPGGMLICAEMFRLFSREFNSTSTAVEQAFDKLGLHEQHGAEKSLFRRVELAGSGQMLNGVLISEFAVCLPEQITIYDPASKTSQQRSATEFIYQLQTETNFDLAKRVAVPELASNGQWQQKMQDTPKSNTRNPLSGR